MIRISPYQGDNRFCVVGYIFGDKSQQETVGWAKDRDSAEALLRAIRNWPRYGDGEVKDFGVMQS